MAKSSITQCFVFKDKVLKLVNLLTVIIELSPWVLIKFLDFLHGRLIEEVGRGGAYKFFETVNKK